MTSKNSNYAAAESHLTFQHNEYTGLPILDEKGRPKLRDSYLLDALECGESSFAMACLIANRKYSKNGRRADVKTYHIWRHPPKRMLIYPCVARTASHTKYIISFDPRDAADNGLTMERAQALGLQFCKDNFPGHPAIVCTHPDGHNSAGNIHVHIVIGSLRVRTVERQPFMDKPCDWEAGKKHRCTSAMLRHLRVAVMEMCEQADLNQINLLEAQGNHVSEREYWAQRRGQRRLDHANANSVRYNYKDHAGKPCKGWETFKTKAEAQERKITVEKELLDGTFLVPDTMTVEEMLYKWIPIQSSKHKWSPKTYTQSVAMVQNLIVPYIGKRKVQDLRTYDIEQFYATLSQTPCGQYVHGEKQELTENQKKRLLSSTSIHEVHTLLKTAFSYAVDWDLIHKSPTPREAPKINTEERTIWDERTMLAALQTIENPALHLAVHMSMILSLHVGEILGL